RDPLVTGVQTCALPICDYVLAFTLPGAGVPLPDTAAAPVEGAYAGETRVGGARIGFDLTIQAVGDSLTAAIARIDSLRVAGAVRSEERRVGKGWRAAWW